MRTIVTVCLGLALAGCGVIPDRETRAAARAEAACRAIGLDPSSEKWMDCMIEMMAAEMAATRTVVHRSRATGGGGAVPQGGNQGNSFMCKDAISRGDSGGTFIFC